MVQWLGLHTFTAWGTGSIPDQGTKILHVAQHGQKKQKQRIIKRFGTMSVKDLLILK